MIIMTNEADKKSLPDLRKVERSFRGQPRGNPAGWVQEVC
jgi:hypothetical protein